MKKNQLTSIFSLEQKDNNRLIRLDISPEESLEIYPRSINRIDDNYFLIARSGIEKYLYIFFLSNETSLSCKFSGEIIQTDQLPADGLSMRYGLNHKNALAIQELFDFTRPVLIGIENSIGFGDRLGLANPGHVRAVDGKNIKPVLAQQSIRELERTGRKPEDVMDTAVWAVFQEGYRDGFGSDADHLKTTDDIDLMVRAGFTMFTFDPGDYVDHDADSLPFVELYEQAKSLSWDEMSDTFENFMKRYENTCFTITDNFSLKPSGLEVLKGIVKYGNVITHAVKMFCHLKDNYPEHPCEIELSVDETDSPTSPFEHFMIVNELKRLGIQLVSLAPRFIGDFEKGIDYKGDLEVFRKEYHKHLQIAESLGPYKISLHSGSDKFSVYEIIGRFSEGQVHVKTAGTSYLEALRTIASTDTDLFREILDYSRDHYETEKKSYHVSADLGNVPPSEKLTDKELLDLFRQNDARQVLHVTFGTVLTAEIGGSYLFKVRILNCLKENEDIHYGILIKHFQQHIAPFV